MNITFERQKILKLLQILEQNVNRLWKWIWLVYFNNLINKGLN